MKWQRWLLGGIWAGLGLIFLTPLLVSNSLLFPFIAGKAFFFRSLVEVVFLLWILLALLDQDYRPRWSALLIVFLSWVVWIGVASLVGANPAHSFWSNFERMEGVITYLHLAAYFIVLVSVLRGSRAWWRFWHLSLGASGLVCCLALGEWLRGAVPGGRLAATLGNPIYLAVYLLINLFITLFFLAQTNFRLERVRWWSYLALGLVQAAVLYGTATRGAMLGAILGVVVAALLVGLFGHGEGQARRLALSLLAAVVISIGLFVVLRQSAWVQSSPVLSRFANISLADATTRHRLLVWNLSWQGFKERPVFGWGPENFNLVFAKYFDAKLYDAEPWFDRSHNILLDWLVTTGVLGLIGYLALFALAIVYLWRSSLALVPKSLLIGLLVGYLFQNTLVFDNLTSYLLFIGLLAFAHAQRPGPSSSKTVSFRLAPAATSAVAALLLLVWVPVFYWSLVRPWQAGRALIEALNSPEPVARLAGFKRAYAYRTFAEEEITEQLVPVALQANNLPGETKQQFWQLANDHLASLTKANPTDARIWGLAGSFYAQGGQLDEAIKALEFAQSLSPKKQAISLQLATAYSIKGDLAAAERVAKAAVELEPNYAEARRLYALILISMRRFAEADTAMKGVEPDDRFINAYAAAGRYEELVGLWQKKVAGDPNNSDYHIRLAAAYVKVGARAKAIAELETALALNPAAQQEINFFISEIHAGRDPSRR